MEKNRYQEIDDRFSRFMFGERRARRENDTAEKTGEIEEIFKNNPNGSTPDIPYWELIEKIDNIMTTLSNFKPLVQKVTPFIEKFISKKD
ncbi:hypothetical protein SAMN05877753_108224 [Bacillus oleivorans]|uniref:Uncharacterized protein n=1 Tax=Bacillus oleivorans TaxID=1448271 RepID=A0A285D354_9BACI|nr:hypothetical protein [Bacillus oleivorans]SNX74199.1 hypothetical protein SAMN05877753_108224 [Bacillus oleivorans]